VALAAEGYHAEGGRFGEAGCRALGTM